MRLEGRRKNQTIEKNDGLISLQFFTVWKENYRTEFRPKEVLENCNISNKVTSVSNVTIQCKRMQCIRCQCICSANEQSKCIQYIDKRKYRHRFTNLHKIHTLLKTLYNQRLTEAETMH